MVGLVTGKGFDGVGHRGDLGVVARLLGVLDEPDRNFAIVTPG